MVGHFSFPLPRCHLKLLKEYKQLEVCYCWRGKGGKCGVTQGRGRSVEWEQVLRDCKETLRRQTKGIKSGNAMIQVSDIVGLWVRKRGEIWRETRSQQQIQNTKLRSVSSSEISSVRLGSSQLGNVWETMEVYGGATYSICWLEKEQFCCKSLVWYLGHSELHI